MASDCNFSFNYSHNEVFDHREYKSLKFKNGLLALLISDPKTAESSAALKINIGSASDTVPGIAHLCKSYVALKMRKFLNPEIFSFLKSRQWSSNFAETYYDHTIFQFIVKPYNFKYIFNEFAALIRQPGVNENDIHLAMDDLHKNYAYIFNEKSKVHYDPLNLLETSYLYPHPRPDSPDFKYGSEGILTDKEGKKIDKAQVESFFRSNYSPNIMTLCVLGQESIHDLEEMVSESFCGMNDKKVILSPWPERYFHQKHALLKIVPLKEDMMELIMIFSIPDAKKSIMPQKYISNILEYEGENTLIEFLTHNGCNSVVTEFRELCRGYSYFFIYINLTEDGFKNDQKIVNVIFQYIEYMKENVDSVFHAQQNFKNVYNYSNIESPNSNVYDNVYLLSTDTLSSLMHLRFPDDSECIDGIKYILDCLNPSNLQLRYVSKKYEKDANKSEYWYDIKFIEEELTQDTIESWLTPLDKNLWSISRNQYIASEFDLKKIKESDITDIPVVVYSSPYIRCWYKPNTEFLIPKANTFLRITSAFIYASIDSYVMKDIFIHYFRKKLKLIIHSAKIGYLNVDIIENRNDIIITIQGFNNKQDILLKDILSTFIHFRDLITQDEFDEIKEKYTVELKDFSKKDPEEIAEVYLNRILTGEDWNIDELNNANHAITLGDFSTFLLDFINEIFMECFIHGNMNINTVIHIAKTLENMSKNVVSYIPPILNELTTSSKIKLDKNYKYVFEINASEKESCLIFYYEIDYHAVEFIKSPVEMESYILVIIENAKHYFGKGTVIDKVEINGMLGLKFRFSIPSNISVPTKEGNIKEFLQRFLYYLETINYKGLSHRILDIISVFVKKQESMYSVSVDFWNEILIQRYNFDRIYKALNFLKMAKSNVKKFIKFCVMIMHTIEKKLIVFIKPVSNVTPLTYNTNDQQQKSNKIYKITDIFSFFKTQFLCPSFKLLDSVSNFKAMKIPQKYVCSKNSYDIIKPESDTRLYRALMLDNNMKILLINDPQIKKSIGTMVVDVGSMLDPIPLNGLAHLCSHMLPTASRKYLNTDEFKDFLKSHKGELFSSIDINDTVYQFKVDTPYLSNALKYFAQCFVAPSFPEDIIIKEENLINKMNETLKNEFTYQYHLFEKWTARETHPYSNIGSNLLSEITKSNYNLRQFLIEFYKIYYSSNLMSLCIISEEGLDNLETMVVEPFCALRNKEYVTTIYDDPFAKVRHYGLRWNILNPKDKKNVLTMKFSLVSQVDRMTLQEKLNYDSNINSDMSLTLQYEIEVIQFLSSLLNNKVKFMNFWKGHSFDGEIVAKESQGPRGIHFFNIEIILNHPDIKDHNQMIAMIFQYLANIMKQEKQVISQEYESIRNKLLDNFNNKLKNSSKKYALENARALLKYPITRVLSAKYILAQWNEGMIDIINKYLSDSLSPQSMMLYFVGENIGDYEIETNDKIGLRYVKINTSESLDYLSPSS